MNYCLVVAHDSLVVGGDGLSTERLGFKSPSVQKYVLRFLLQQCHFRQYSYNEYIDHTHVSGKMDEGGRGLAISQRILYKLCLVAYKALNAHRTLDYISDFCIKVSDKRL